MRSRALLGVVLITLASACTDNRIRLFNLIPSKEAGISFSNTIKSSDDFNIFSYRNFYNGGGVAIADFNNDNLPDIYLISNMNSNRLFLNKGDFKFEDITERAGVSGKKAWSTGATIADVNNDGLLDIYVCNAGYLPEMSNQENELFVNNGDLTFTEKAKEYGLNHNGYSTHAAFFDYDSDGDLDVYIVNNSFMPVNTLNYSNNRELDAQDWPVKDFLKGGGDKLFRNDNGFYNDVTKEAGIYSSLIGFGLGVTVGDVNGDHLPDIYVSNDFFERDYLYMNNGDGTFKEDIENRMEHISMASMGADIADINNDGFPEIFVSEMLPDEEKRLKTEVLFENYPNYYLKLKRGFYHQYMHNTLQLNNGDDSFSEIAWYSGVAASDWSWGALIFDADNDGFRDIYICNGTVHDVTNQDFIDFFTDQVVQKMALTGEKDEIEYVMNRMPSNKQYNRYFHNKGNLKFEEIGIASGFDVKSFSNGAAYGDLDNDGDLDLVVNNLNQEAFIYRNNSENVNDYHFVSIKLKGSANNTFAIGSKVEAYSGRNLYNAYLMPSRGFQSSVDYKIIFGLGMETIVDSIVVIWPDKNRTLLVNPKIDTTYNIEYLKSIPAAYTNPYQASVSGKYFRELNTDFTPHKEDEYIDFLQEGLVIKMLSREGQAGDIGDVNGDGLDDIFLGGAAGQSGQLYLNSKNGYVIHDNRVFERDSLFEDTAVKFFDADQDGDVDLYVGSGGNHQVQNAGVFQDWIYINDGRGNFERQPEALPYNALNTSVICPFDIDNDGDLDLFVGSRSVPMNYGISPQSYIYENTGDGKFKDATLYFAPFLKSIGMITDAKFVDVIDDEEEELILVGEWMSPVILKKSQGKYVQVTSNLTDYHGWWYAIESDDVDADGDMDLILGNRGENFYFTGTFEAPAKLWLYDFDNNGITEKIITKQVNGKDVTVALKKELTEQILSLDKQNITHEEFAVKTFNDLFTKDALEKASVKKANWFSTSIAFNDGNGNFKVTALPQKVQFSSVNAILCIDVNGDNYNDLLLGGNDSGFMPQYSKLDASFGHVLLNDGSGNYSIMNGKEEGFFVKGVIRHLMRVKLRVGDGFLVLLNNQKPKLYEVVNERNE